MSILGENERIDDVNDNIRLIQRRDGLTFGTDALLLASYIKAEPSARALELGAGSGIISLLVASRGKAAHVDCAEVQSVFADISRRNAELNRLSDKISVLECDIRTLKDREEKHKYDIVFSNPPYMKSSSGKPNESPLKNIARHEEFGTIDDFAACASDMLKFGGKFYCVYRPDRMAELFSALERHGLQPKRLTLVHAYASSKPSMLLLMASSGGRPSMEVTEPLILYKENSNEFTEKTAYIYENGSFMK